MAGAQNSIHTRLRERSPRFRERGTIVGPFAASAVPAGPPRRGPHRFALAAGVALILALSAVPPRHARAAEAVDFPTAVSRALARNAAVAAAGHEATAARKEAEIARGRYLPNLLFEERFARTTIPAEAFAFTINEERLKASDFADVDNFNKPAPVNDFITILSLEQPIFAPKAILGYRMAGREAEAAGLDLSRRKEETVYRVLSAYLGVLTAKEYIRVTDQALSGAREHRRVAGVLESAGTGLSSDTLRADVAVARAQADLVSAQNRLALAQKALALAMGETGGSSVEAAGPLPSLPDPGSLETRIAAAAERRADLRAVSLRAGNAGTNVALQRSGYLPEVGASAAVQMDGRDSPFSPDNREWRVGVGLTWTLFDGLRREAAVAKARAQRAGAEERYRGARDQAAFQVAQAYLSWQEADRRAAIARAAAASAEEGLRLIARRYENQIGRLVDVLDAQSALDMTRADLVRAENDLLQSRAELEYVSGTLLPWAAAGIGGEQR